MNLSCRTPPQDKREATKWRNRRAIVDAASELAALHGVDGFTVRDLAERAGVSRRTVFNHFTGIDDAVYESFSDRIGALFEQVEASLGDARFATMPETFEAFARALRTLDILGTAHSLIAPMEGVGWGEISETSEPPRVVEIWMNRIMEGIVRSCADSLQRRTEDADPFEVRMLVSLVAAGLGSCVRQWAETTDGSLSSADRQQWERLLDRCLDRLASGYGEHRPA